MLSTEGGSVPAQASSHPWVPRAVDGDPQFLRVAGGEVLLVDRTVRETVTSVPRGACLLNDELVADGRNCTEMRSVLRARQFQTELLLEPAGHQG